MTSMVRSYLGKVFLSHSTADQKFVRHLDARLRRSGYETWLDEHELVVGDPLGSRIAEGVRAAKSHFGDRIGSVSRISLAEV